MKPSTKNKLRLLSPDGFDTTQGAEYSSEKAIKVEMASFVKRYEKQGYYSSRGERIHLLDLPDYCSVIPVNHQTAN